MLFSMHKPRASKRKIKSAEGLPKNLRADSVLFGRPPLPFFWSIGLSTDVGKENYKWAKHQPLSGPRITATAAHSQTPFNKLTYKPATRLHTRLCRHHLSAPGLTNSLPLVLCFCIRGLSPPPTQSTRSNIRVCGARRIAGFLKKCRGSDTVDERQRGKRGGTVDEAECG